MRRVARSGSCSLRCDCAAEMSSLGERGCIDFEGPASGVGCCDCSYSNGLMSCAYGVGVSLDCSSEREPRGSDAQGSWSNVLRWDMGVYVQEETQDAEQSLQRKWI